MALESMRDEMIRQIKARMATEEQVSSYLAEWYSAIDHTGKPLPCPLCYVNGEIKRLKAISEQKGIAVVRCEQCHVNFEFESPS
jgi:hypothetical protein